MKRVLILIAMMAMSSTAYAQIGYVSCVIGRPLPLPDILQELLDAERQKGTIKPLTTSKKDDFICHLEPASTACAQYQTRQIEIEKSCVAYFRQTSNTSCWYEKQLPNVCEQYRPSTSEE